MIKTIIARFTLMHPYAFFLLRLCLFLTMASVFMLYLYVDTITQMQRLLLSHSSRYITECVIWAVLISFGGAFLLDYAEEKQKSSS